MATEIICTPVGLTVPGGKERVDKAYSEFMDKTSNVANLLDTFLTDFDEEFASVSDVNENFADGLLELHDAVTFRNQAQEELFRALAGVPAVDEIKQEVTQ